MLYTVDYDGWIGIINVKDRHDPDELAYRHVKQYFPDAERFDYDWRPATQEDIEHVRGMGGYIPKEQS